MPYIVSIFAEEGKDIETSFGRPSSKYVKSLK